MPPGAANPALVGFDSVRSTTGRPALRLSSNLRASSVGRRSHEVLFENTDRSLLV